MALATAYPVLMNEQFPLSDSAAWAQEPIDPSAISGLTGGEGNCFLEFSLAIWRIESDGDDRFIRIGEVSTEGYVSVWLGIRQLPISVSPGLDCAGLEGLEVF